MATEPHRPEVPPGILDYTAAPLRLSQLATGLRHRWFLVPVALYVIVILGLSMVPGLLVGDSAKEKALWSQVGIVAVVLLGGAMLIMPIRMILRLPTRRGSIAWVVVGTLIMGAAMIWTIGLAISELVPLDRADPPFGDWAIPVGLGVYAIWAVLFFSVARPARDGNRSLRLPLRLIEGSILELLVAVPSHIIVRQRDYCCAGFGTGLGLITGFVVMLLAFGPSVFILYVRRCTQIAVPADVARSVLPGRLRLTLAIVLAALALAALFLPASWMPRVGDWVPATTQPTRW